MSVLLNMEPGPNPGPGDQVTWDILHPASGLSIADLSKGELVRAWTTEPGSEFLAKQCGQCPGLKMSFWSHLTCQFSLGRTSLKSGWAVKGWVPQSTCTSLVAPCGRWSPHSPPHSPNAFVLCREWQ